MLKFFIAFNPITFLHVNTFCSIQPIRVNFTDLYLKKTTESSVAYADNTFLPLRRRRAITFRPFFVLILAQNRVLFSFSIIWLKRSFHYMTPPVKHFDNDSLNYYKKNG